MTKTAGMRRDEAPNVQAAPRSAAPRSPVGGEIDSASNPIWSRLARSVNPGLTVGPADDISEREADSVAERVVSADASVVRRKATDDVSASAGSAGTRTPGLGRDGRTLPPGERAYFEPRFGRDFSGIRVHTDDDSARASAAIQARAFTHGRDVYFGSGQYRPGTAEGRRLIAHELAHTLQPGGGSVIRRAPGWGEQIGDWVFGETDGEKKDTGESPGVVWRWLTWFGIGLADLIAGVIGWFGLEDYDIAADLVRHYMSGRGADYELVMPDEWAAKIVEKYKSPRSPREVSSYKWGIPDLRNSLGHFDLGIVKNADGSKTYTATDKYHFPHKPNDKWEQGRHGFQVPFFGSLPAEVRDGVNAALAALGTWTNPGGFNEVFEVKVIDREWTFLIPQQWLADSGVDFALHSEFTVSASGEIDTGGGWF